MVKSWDLGLLWWDLASIVAWAVLVCKGFNRMGLMLHPNLLKTQCRKKRKVPEKSRKVPKKIVIL